MGQRPAESFREVLLQALVNMLEPDSAYPVVAQVQVLALVEASLALLDILALGPVEQQEVEVANFPTMRQASSCLLLLVERRRTSEGTRYHWVHLGLC